MSLFALSLAKASLRPWRLLSAGPRTRTGALRQGGEREQF